MKKIINTDDINPIDFSGEIRGKHIAVCKRGYSIKVHREDGTTLIHKFVPEKGVIVLDEDIRGYFQDVKAVNTACAGS